MKKYLPIVTKHVQMIRLMLSLQLSTLVSFRADFLLGLIGFLVQQILNIIVIFGIFTQVSAIAGYSLWEILLFRGFYLLATGIDRLYNDNIWSFAISKIRDGRFAAMLLKPLDPLLHIVLERMGWDALGSIMVGGVVFSAAFHQLGLPLSIGDALLWLLFLLFALIGLFALKLIGASAAFYSVSSENLMKTLMEVTTFARYPLSIQPLFGVRFLLTFIVPFGLLAYLPCASFIGRVTLWPIALEQLAQSTWGALAISATVSSTMLALALACWRFGLRSYEPTGS